MTVFYSSTDQGHLYSFIEWIEDEILDVDVSYWVVPGTLED